MAPNFAYSYAQQSEGGNIFPGYEIVTGLQEQYASSGMNRELSSQSTNTQSSYVTDMSLDSRTTASSQWEELKQEDWEMDDGYNISPNATEQFGDGSQHSPGTLQATYFSDLSLDNNHQLNPFATVQGQYTLADYNYPSSNTTSYNGCNSRQTSQTTEQIHTSNLTTQASPAAVSQKHYKAEAPEEKHTPSSLGWSHDTQPPAGYKLIMPRNKEPYLELDRDFEATFDTPRRVYFDQPR